MPHEVDDHPDGARINATVEEVAGPLRERLAVLEDELGRAEEERNDARADADDAERAECEARDELNTERARRVALSNAAEWLLIGLVTGDKVKVRRGLADLAVCGVDAEFLTTVEAAEVAGHADFLAGEEAGE
jgi:hypothetical protein